MKIQHLFNQFTRGTNWNAALYITYKILFTILSFLLLKILTTNDFAAWANINSAIFLILLWLDFGFRKSVPRFCPEFARYPNKNKQFISAIIIFQACVLVASIPLIRFCLTTIAQRLNQPPAITILIGSTLFITQGIIAAIRLLYHSYFLHKQFNLLAIIIMIAETIANIILIYTLPTSTILLHNVLTNKILADSTIIICSSFMFIKLLPTIIKPNATIPQKDITKRFIKHSVAMWMNNNIKSLSERNFLVPFMTITTGPAFANIFKVANDAALLFYRIIIKTIGTTDTSLLTYIELSQQKNYMKMAFTKLTTKITSLSLPLLGIIIFISIQKDSLLDDPFVFHAFIIMVGGYLIETMLIPYERLLEVKGKYWYLFLGHIPYITMLVILRNNTIISFIGLLGFISLVQGVRLVSIGIITCFAYHLYKMPLPIRFILTRIFWYGLLFGFLVVLLSIEPIRHIVNYLIQHVPFHYFFLKE